MQFVWGDRPQKQINQINEMESQTLQKRKVKKYEYVRDGGQKIKTPNDK